MKWPWNAGCYVQRLCNCPIPFLGAFAARAWPLVLQADFIDGMTIFSLIFNFFHDQSSSSKWSNLLADVTCLLFLALSSYQLLCQSPNDITFVSLEVTFFFPKFEMYKDVQFYLSAISFESLVRDWKIHFCDCRIIKLSVAN